VTLNRSPETTPADSRTFSLDRFQLEAFAAVDAGESVLVAAPTGSGKTVVAERAVEQALRTGTKAFYTTPIKALSNQKFHDLVRRHGADNVGLLTGDNAVNADAPVVVMTTEVLRNMLYARSRALQGLRWVVLDEVHYLQDAYRGPTWEEVIIHLPPEVSLVCLSATVSNAEELVQWLRTVRGPTAMVLETTRPVELTHLFAVDDRYAERMTVLPTLVDGRPNREGERFERNPSKSGSGGGRPRRRYAPPTRVEVVEWLAASDMLPAINFIFSRAGCDDAVRSCVDAGIRLTTAAQRARIDEIADHHLRGLSDADLITLDHDRWRAALHAGISSHHAGLVPPFKEAVEACFCEGLVPVVFATETLALGINMPARTVVIEKLTKFTGERHEFLTPGQFTQLTGRAGRRGIDPVGNALVLWSPFVSFGEVAGLVSSRSFPLTSAFRPTYNMAANLVRRYPPERAHHLLGLSFAQYQADRGVVALEQGLARRRAERATLIDTLTCDADQLADYAALADEVTKEGTRARRASAEEVRSALAALRPGDVIAMGGTTVGGLAAVLSVAHRKGGGVRVRVIGATRRVLLVGDKDLDAPPVVVNRITLPLPFTPRSTAFQRQVASALHDLPQQSSSSPPPDTAHAPHDEVAPLPDADALAMAQHVLADHPDLAANLKIWRRVRRVDQAIADQTRQVASRSGSLRRRFDLVLALLERWDHVRDWTLTQRGEQLVSVFHECDLLIVEALSEGLFDGLDAAEVAALTSAFVYEHRSPGPAPSPWFPPGALQSRWERLDKLAGALVADERRAGLTPTRRPDPGFMAVAHAWASGGDLDEVLEDEELTAGDFVRTMKVLLDLLGQVSRVATDPDTAQAADIAAQASLRGLVAASSLVNAQESGHSDNPEDGADVGDRDADVSDHPEPQQGHGDTQG
jgi:ATP-dependent RNA helicase HelY